MREEKKKIASQRESIIDQKNFKCIYLGEMESSMSYPIGISSKNKNIIK